MATYIATYNDTTPFKFECRNLEDAAFHASKGLEDGEMFAITTKGGKNHFFLKGALGVKKAKRNLLKQWMMKQMFKGNVIGRIG